MTEKKKVNLSEKSFEEIAELYYNNPNEKVTLGVLLETLRKFEIRLIKEYGLNAIKKVEDNKE